MVSGPIADAHLLVAKSDTAETDRDSSDGSTEPARWRTDDGADTVTTVETIDDALERVTDGLIDCVVTGRTLVDGSGLELLEAIRERDATLPVVLAPVDGDESLASEAITAGVTEYVAADRSPEERGRAIERAIETGRRRRRRRSRARGFTAVFEDSETQSWLLEPDARVRRANEVALEAIDATGTDVVGRPFLDVSPWHESDDERATLRKALETAANGSVVRRELPWTASGETDGSEDVSAEIGRTDSDRSRTLSVTIRPVRDETGTVTSVLVRAEDVTERAGLEQELRESEELHRVTLNNMTDTVLVTDDDGEFTYVCPNVHFIFGYDDDEIHEMGTIDELLGAELFDREELAEGGVLTNIECTATDEAGREHTLLVNVREVSIQDGKTLYSCRDVTERKRRDEALTALHRTTRRLLYAETDREIVDLVVGDATDVLALEASGIYRFDPENNVLQPAAHSSGMAELHGPLSAERVGDENVLGAVFLEGESRFFEDITDAAAFSNPTTDVRSAAFVPLGDHGVFVVGSSSPDEFDDASRELTDLLAATTEAALDRVERERTLRERDRELKRRNRQLTRLNRINELIREIDAALVQAETREEIEQAVCDRLTAADRFSVAWIGASDDGGDHLEVRAYGGPRRGREYLDSVSLSLSGDATEPAVRTATHREVTVVSNVVDGLRDERWRGEALAAEYQSVLGVPLSYDEFTYGVLTVYADRPDAFDDVTRSVFDELGETIASAIAAVERKSALLSDSSNRLEFAVRDESSVFTRLAERADCTLWFDGGVRQHDDGATVFASVEGASATDVVAAAADLVAVEDAQVVDGGPSPADDDDRTGGTVRLVLSRPFFALRLADHGIVLRRLVATPSLARIVVDVPSSVDARESADIVSSEFEDVDLRSKQTVDRTMRADGRADLLDTLTDRQLEVVQLAYYGGYFESPRARSGEDVAETLEISPAAFYQHVRTAQRKLFEALFDGTAHVLDDEVGLNSEP
ncbi:bacterio-opsin activator domain-containing protein [Natrialba sp. INN-245]|uniref:bacterio-opsin activator domain-containing protein n=1 Tax=Natrialba sp. INN-245 TaxID=2690967 RepID=UPI0013131799|nr:bacterio-opsin activator domain-containing protein [Natrialba sp. INN-245]MWV39852.1 GAF domain-containing protein [Natrialba sp. INN-245]